MSDLMMTAMERIQASYAVPNATFDGKPPSIKELESLKMVKAMAFTIEYFQRTGKRYNFLFNGGAGIAKTATGFAMAKANDLRPLYLNAGNMDQENLGMPSVQKRGSKEAIVWALIRQYVEEGNKVLILDEPGQSDPGFLSAVMEILSEGSIGGVPIQDLVSIWLFDNPSNALNGDLSEFDLAQADRGGTMFVTSADTPWEYGLATQFADLNLKKVFNEYYRLPLSEQGRDILSPRVLEHIINALRMGFNGNLGRPIMNDRYAPIPSTTGEDMGDEVVERIAKALDLPNPSMSTNDFDRAISLIPTEGIDVLAYGTQGTGKTSRAKAQLAKTGVQVAYKSVPVISKEDINLSVVSEDGKFVDIITHEEFMSEVPTVGIFDEITRGTRRTMNALMEIIQEHTSGGQELPNYKGTLMLTNLSKAGEEEMDVEEVSLPFATRPDLNFILGVDDLHSMEWLVETYGDEIVPFTEWWRMDLDGQPEYRLWASPRFLERAFHFYQGGLDVQWALPAPHGEYVPVPLVKLHARLGGTPMVSFLNLVESTDDYESRLAAADEKTRSPLDMELHLGVFTALLNAELPLLKGNRDVCVRMFKVLAEQWQIKLMKTSDDKWFFWTEVLQEAVPDE